jgi:hypothetical protein
MERNKTRAATDPSSQTGEIMSSLVPNKAVEEFVQPLHLHSSSCARHVAAKSTNKVAAAAPNKVLGKRNLILYVKKDIK